MRLTPRELDHLRLHGVGCLAQKRLARGVKLNYPETVALIATVIMELVRDGTHSLAELMYMGTQLLGINQVQSGIANMVEDVQVEATFPDGTKLVTIHSPIVHENGNLELALYGSFLPIPQISLFMPKAFAEGSTTITRPMIPGHVQYTDTLIQMNQGSTPERLAITNLSDRPIQIGSHYHLIESNRYLEMDRQAAYGKRLNIPAGTAVRFEPGDSKTVSIISIGGHKNIQGGNRFGNGVVSDENRTRAMAVIEASKGTIAHSSSGLVLQGPDALLQCSLPKHQYGHIFGPTIGDKIQLGDTNLIIEIEKDFAIYGNECKFGGGKTLREGMGQATGLRASEVVDVIITNVIILDYTGIIKADVGIKDGKIVAIGKGGNPDIMDGVDPNLVVGVNTEAIAGEGLILTAGGFDAHVHFICPQLCEEALASGLTTLLGGGTGPATGTCATTCTPGPAHVQMMLEATDIYPLNIGLTGKGNTASPVGLQDTVDAGVVGLKLHEDWGTTPAAIDTCLSIAESNDIQVTIHTDTLNESCCLEDTIAAFKNRTIHTYHSEGAGGGHAPDIIQVCGELHVLPSSTNPTRPYTVNTLDEHLDMLMVCHHLDKNIVEDVAFAESRIRGETIAAEDILHDMGAISIISSDSQAMGRIGEVITRTWQTANKMKLQRGFLPEDEAQENDNFRVKRYVAKYTINPAIAHGMSHEIGSIEIGKWADCCLWKPMFFGAKPEMIIKGGSIVYAQMGDPNASIPTPEPTVMRPMFGSKGKAVGNTSIVFVSKSSIEKGIVQQYQLTKRIEPVLRTRNLTKKDMKHNDALPTIHVDPETYQVTVDGSIITCAPASTLPLSQRYFLF